MESLAMLGGILVFLFIFRESIGNIVGLFDNTVKEVVVDGEVKHVKKLQKLTSKVKAIKPDSYETSDTLLSMLRKENV